MTIGLTLSSKVKLVAIVINYDFNLKNLKINEHALVWVFFQFFVKLVFFNILKVLFYDKTIFISYYNIIV